ncbi:MAG: histidinol dehydrogenase [Woeseiaceae bacterium]|nr:histidinol dehydrogenase [Woeseiaceae bacterium]
MIATPQPVTWSILSDDERAHLLRRPALTPAADVDAAVSQIIARVRRDGDDALRELTEELDNVRLDDFLVRDAEFAAARAALSAAARQAIDAAITNVRRFHEAQRTPDIDIETVAGVRCQRVTRPVQSVGLYVPAGTAPLPSAAIMLAVPAAIAGCPRRASCTPPRRDGSADPAVLVAAKRAGVSEVLKLGGAQAIAALAYGTESIAAVDKIFGPGNTWVTAAKTRVAADPEGSAVDMPAGPSEVLVIADETADPDFVASDLLSQAEHGGDSQVILLTTCAELAEQVARALPTQLNELSRRTIAAEALAHCRLLIVKDLQAAVTISNAYAPEHLIIQVRDARALLESITNAGSVFLGSWSPESVGDYCSGTNHVLPTYGAARSYSGLGVEQFTRQMTVQELTAAGLRTLSPTVIELATLEGLDAHAAAVRLRLAATERSS